jgi:putative two-component system response regulator
MKSSMDVQQALLRLNEIGIALSCERNLNRLLNKILSEARSFTRAEAGTLYLREGDSLEFAVFQNDALAARAPETEQHHEPKPVNIPLSTESMAGYVGVTGSVINIPDVYHLSTDLPYTFNPDFDQKNQYRSCSMLIVPMHDPLGHIIGVLQLINALDSTASVIPFDPSYETLCLSLASQAAVAVLNGKLTDKLHKAYMDTIFRLAMAAEYRDTDTANHLHRICDYTAVIASQLGLSDEWIQDLHFASPMHDIGKIGIPDAILLKPGKLTAEEFDEMKKHTVIGAKILSRSESEILRLSEEIALNHHEKFNGAGYPYGTQEVKIPLSARIVAVADVFDAMTSKRCYKAAFPVEQVLETMMGERGKHFCPDCLDAFFAKMEQILLIQKKYTDESA